MDPSTINEAAQNLEAVDNIPTFLSMISPISTSIAIGFSAFVALIVGVITYLLNRSKRLDELNTKLSKMHDFFWSEPDFIFMRKLILINHDYNMHVSSIKARLNGIQDLTSDQYDIIEKIDRYVDFVTRVDAVTRRYRFNSWPLISMLNTKFVEEILFEYWLQQIVVRKRYELFSYVVVFFYAMAQQGMKNRRKLLRHQPANENDKQDYEFEKSLGLLHRHLRTDIHFPEEKDRIEFRKHLSMALQNRSQLPNGVDTVGENGRTVLDMFCPRADDLANETKKEALKT